MAKSTTLTVKFPTAQRIELSCISRGSPPPAIEWFRDGSIPCGDMGDGITMDEMFPPQNTNLLERCSINSAPGYTALVIYNPRVEDTGTYTCVAENSVASSEAYVLLQVEGNVHGIIRFL